MKIVFLTSNINEPRVPNRIAEFKERGYELEVFCYCRDPERPYRKEEGVTYHQLGEVGRGSSSYFKRLFAEYKDVRNVIRDKKGEDVVFYLINNDMALLYYLIGGKHPFIYEEADLRHTYFGSALLRRLFERWDKHIIRRSLLTVFLSKGFSTFHYGTKRWRTVSFPSSRRWARALTATSTTSTPTPPRARSPKRCTPASWCS